MRAAKEQRVKEFKFRMLEVISSYQELTGFLPVELTDKCSTAEVMSDNYTSQWLVNFGGRRPLTPFNSQQAELAKVKVKEQRVKEQRSH